LSAADGGVVSSQPTPSWDGQRFGSVAEFAAAGEDVRESVARGFDGQRFALAGLDGNVDVNGISGNAFDWTALAPETATDEAHVRTVIVGDFRNVRRFHFLITRRSHLLR